MIILWELDLVGKRFINTTKVYLIDISSEQGMLYQFRYGRIKSI